MKVRAVVLNNWPLKLFSLVCGILIYFVLHSVTQVEKEFPLVNVRVNLPEEQKKFFNVHYNVSQVKVILIGPQNRVESVNAKDLEVILDLSADRVRGGTHSLSLQEKQLSGLPPTVSVKYVPEVFKFDLVEYRERRLDVKPVVEAVTDFEIALVVADPSSVKVRGPKQVVEKMSFLETKPFREKIDYIFQNRHTIELKTEYEKGNLEITPGSVELNFHLKERSERREILAVPISILRNPGENLEVNLDRKTIDLVVTAPPQLADGTALQNLDPASFFAFVDVRGLAPTTGGTSMERKINIWTPYGDSITVKPKGKVKPFVRVVLSKP